jgi:hypothetical protein
MSPVALAFAILLAPAPAVCPAVSAQEVTEALQHVGEVGPWAVEGQVQPYPNVPYYECNYVSGLPKLNRQVTIQVRAGEGLERTNLKPSVVQVSRTAIVAPRVVAGLGDEAWFFVASDGTGHLNVRSGVAVVHVAVNLHTSGGNDQTKKLDAASAVAAHALRRLKSGEIAVTKK